MFDVNHAVCLSSPPELTSVRSPNPEDLLPVEPGVSGGWRRGSGFPAGVGAQSCVSHCSLSFDKVTQTVLSLSWSPDAFLSQQLLFKWRLRNGTERPHMENFWFQTEKSVSASG